jgi:hypothetical protein
VSGYRKARIQPGLAIQSEQQSNNLGGTTSADVPAEQNKRLTDITGSEPIDFADDALETNAAISQSSPVGKTGWDVLHSIFIKTDDSLRVPEATMLLIIVIIGTVLYQDNGNGKITNVEELKWCAIKVGAFSTIAILLGVLIALSKWIKSKAGSN